MKKIPDELRPTCACGKKMELIKYVGCYDEFFYWDCDCDLMMNYTKWEPDDISRGQYA